MMNFKNETKGNQEYIEEVIGRETELSVALFGFVSMVYDSNEYTSFQILAALDIVKLDLYRQLADGNRRDTDAN